MTPSSDTSSEATTFLTSILLYDAVSEMCDLGGVDNLRAFKFDVLRACVLEQSDSVTEQYGGEMDLQFVDQSSFYALPDGVRTAYNPYVLVFCGCSCLLKGALDAIGDEREGRSSLPDSGLSRMVGEDEYRCAKRRRIRPRHLSLAEYPAAHHVSSAPDE